MQKVDHQAGMSHAEKRQQVLAAFVDFIQTDVDEFFAYMRHCGIRDEDVAAAGAAGLEGLILGHYRIDRTRFDLDRVGSDLATWPPIAARISELTAQKAAKEAKAAAKRQIKRSA